MAVVAVVSVVGVASAQPAIDSVTPDGLLAGAGGTSVTITGSGFGSVGASVTATYSESGELQATAGTLLRFLTLLVPSPRYIFRRPMHRFGGRHGAGLH